MTTLRESVLNKIREFGDDPERASIEICILMDDKIGLSGNGWFDNDEVMVKELGLDAEDEEDEQEE
jgi:hypothetical protein